MQVNHFRLWYYGGDARTTFGVPDLRGRMPLGSTGGTGPGLPPYQIGQKQGNPYTSISALNMPPHTHDATFTPSGGGSATGELKALDKGADKGINGNPPINGDYIAATGGTVSTFGLPGGFGVNEVTVGGLTITGGGGSGTVSVANSGSGTQFSTQPAFQAINFCFAMDGIFPARS